MTCTTITPIAPATRNPFAGLIQRYEEWNNRRGLRRVLDLDDHILRDIGLTHNDVETAIARRLSENAGEELMASRNPHLR